jgi:hypothetical protein
MRLSRLNEGKSIYKEGMVMEESEWLMTFMTNLNDITSSWWPFNDGRYEIFKPNIEPTNISYCTVLYHTIPFRPEGD